MNAVPAPRDPPLQRTAPAAEAANGSKETAMSNNFRVNDERSTLGAGVKVLALVAVVGMIALAASKGTVAPDEIAAEEAEITLHAASAPATSDALMAQYGPVAPGAPTSRDPSVPAVADVVSTTRDETPAPTF
jgi:hypothetical protein